MASSSDLANLGEHGFAESGGVKIHFVNKGSGPLVVLIHGIPGFWPTYCDSPELQQELLGPLIEFICGYEQMAGECGLARHRAIFDSHPGPKREYTVLET
jgi:pimeloyl-ACP methyl ester carboxylesterase